MLEMERYALGLARPPADKDWTFVCPVCGKRFTYDQPGEPMCTGPSETRDEHCPEVMDLVSVRTRSTGIVGIAPDIAAIRKEGTLYIPSGVS